MNNTIFQEIDKLHSQWNVMDKATRLGWLTGERMRLNRMANQFALNISLKRGVMNDAEKTYARELLEMIQAVDAEGAKTVNELQNEAEKELIKLLIRS